MRKLLGILALSAGLLTIGGSATAATANTCTTSKVAVTRLVPVKRDGHVVKRHGKVVRHRVDVRHRVRVRVKVRGRWRYVWRETIRYRTVTTCPSVSAPTPNVTTPTTTSAPASSSTPSTVTYTAVDPSFTQDVTSPLRVTYAYSASATSGSTNLATTGQLPSGVLNLYSDGTLECSATVGGAITGNNCFVTYAKTGNYSITVEYLPNGANPVTSVEIADITPYSTTTTAAVTGTETGPSSCGSGCEQASYSLTASSTVTSQTGEQLSSTGTSYGVTVAGTGISVPYGTGPGASDFTLTVKNQSGAYSDTLSEGAPGDMVQVASGTGRPTSVTMTASWTPSDDSYTGSVSAPVAVTLTTIGPLP